MRKFELSIIAWDEHQERPDRLNYSWFKFHAKTINGHFWAETTSDELKVWLCLLCLRNGQSGEIVHTNDLTLAGYCNLKPAQVTEIIGRLIDLAAVRDESRANPAARAETRGEPAVNPSIVEESRGEESRAARVLTPPWLAEVWNEFCDPLPKVKDPLRLNPRRKADASRRLREHPSCDDWVAAIKRVSLSTKCQGLENEPGKFENWKADFDWLIKPGRLDQILEGKWDGRKPRSSKQVDPFTQSLLDLEAKKARGA